MGVMQMVRNLLDALAYVFKGGIHMVDMYLALVIAGRRTCNPDNKTVTQVPKRYREAVLTELEALGLDADGNPNG